MNRLPEELPPISLARMFQTLAVADQVAQWKKDAWDDALGE